jgi:L,D-transpeptidase ErfK/SrfK
VIAKETGPIWFVPLSIQEEMVLRKEAKTIVPQGPDNPLGRYALQTTLPGIIIHETITPASVNQYRSHGCIRVHAKHMEKFFEDVESNTSGELIYMPVKAAISDDGRIFLEVSQGFLPQDQEHAGRDNGATGNTVSSCILMWDLCGPGRTCYLFCTKY